MLNNLIPADWVDKLNLPDQYEEALLNFLDKTYSAFAVYPKPEEVFKAFELTEFDSVRVVILGEPYSFGGHAHGIAFSSQKQDTPASLKIIFREIDRDVIKTENLTQFKQYFPTNNLTSWTKQGVLLLNTALTVTAGEPLSHKDIWEPFTTAVIKAVWQSTTPKVWLLWGKEAQTLVKKATQELKQDDEINHLLLSGHPATASKGKDKFSGCNHFSKTNYWFWRQGLPEIDWRLV